MKIELGGGRNPKKGFINIDIINLPEVQHILNIDKEKLPFEDNSVNEVYSHHTLEHCENIIFIMNEIWRVCNNNADVYIIVPYGYSYQFIQDPTHKTAFNESSFRKYFCDKNYVKSFSDYNIKGFFKENEIYIKGKDILHLELHVKLKVIK